MKFFKSISSVFFGILLCSHVTAQEKNDKIATVNMQRLVAEYYKTAQTRESFKGYEVGIQKQNEDRTEAIRAIVEEVRKIAKEAEDPSLSREKRAKLFTQQENTQKEARALQQEQMAWVNRKQSALKEKANVEFSVLRKEIIEMVQEVGEAEGYDFIFDRSGGSGAGIPILSFAKDATDITAQMLKRINRDAPKEGEEKPDEGEKPE